MAGVRRRGKTFTITAYLGYDAQGKQRKKTTTYRPPANVTPGKAEKLARAYAVTWEESVRGYVALDENRTFAELAAWYYNTIAPVTLKPNVLLNQKSEIQNHVLPSLGHEKLRNITPAMIDALLRQLQIDGKIVRLYRLKDRHIFDGWRRDALAATAGIGRAVVYFALRGQGVRQENAQKLADRFHCPVDEMFDEVTQRRGLSGASVNKIRMNLSAIFTAAVKKEIIRRNPCSLTTPPKKDTAPALYLNTEQCKTFLQLLRDQADRQLEMFCTLLLATGMRPGECAALHWDDVDLHGGLVHVRYTLTHMDGAFIRQTPKTIHSERRIVLPPYIVRLLALFQMQQNERPNMHGSVFTNRYGNYINCISLNAKLRRLLRATALPQIHLHSLRHTHASLLINADITARVVADRLGHADTSTTLNIYSHVFEESAVKTMQAVEMELFDMEKS